MARKSIKTTVRKIIREMVGRIDAIPHWLTSFNIYQSIGYESIDASKPNFQLSRAVYHATVMKSATGKDIGQKYVLGAVFAKPIINSAAAFAFGSPPTISVDGEEKNKTVEYVNDWLRRHKAAVFDITRYAMRDGASYLRLNHDVSAPIIESGERVEIKIDPKSGKLVGYDVTVKVKDGDKTPIVYRTEYRKDSPQKKVIKIEDGKETEVDSVTKDGIQPLDIVAFHNEKEPSFIYGMSEFQNLYYLMANYHAVLENAIKNNIFNSVSLPFITGVDDMDVFSKTHGSRQDDGTYAFAWDAQKVLIGGKDFDIKMLNTAKNAGEAQTLLEILFWSICQTSETPEFVMGTAVSSSKASVSEQMPVMIRKAERKQRQFEVYFRELVDLIITKGMAQNSLTVLDEYTITYPEIIDDDMKLNIEIVKTLSDEGLISDKTKAIMLGLDKYVGDLAEEIKTAKEESAIAEKKMADSIAKSQTLDRESSGNV